MSVRERNLGNLTLLQHEEAEFNKRALENEFAQVCRSMEVFPELGREGNEPAAFRRSKREFQVAVLPDGGLDLLGYRTEVERGDVRAPRAVAAPAVAASRWENPERVRTQQRWRIRLQHGAAAALNDRVEFPVQAASGNEGEEAELPVTKSEVAQHRRPED